MDFLLIMIAPPVIVVVSLIVLFCWGAYGKPTIE